MKLINNLKTDLKTLGRLELIELITLLLLIFYIDEVWYLEQPVRVLCLAGLIFKSARKNIEFWLIILSLFVSSNLINWYTIDNHMYLMMYWCLSFLLARIIATKSNNEENALMVLGLNGQWMLGLCLSISVLWKVLNPEYMDGSFFEFTILTDDRFANFIYFMTDLPLEKLRENSLLETNFFSTNKSTALLTSNSKVETVAFFLTWWTILIESLIGLFFLIPDRLLNQKLRLSKHWSLIIFILSTYLIAPVFGFAWLLILFALSHLPERYEWTRLTYVIVLLMTQVYRLPIGEIIERIKAL